MNNPKTIIKHDMVHIEVFLGGKTGEKTIGSRTSLGQVSYHNSYKFVGRKYNNIQYHFKSLDTWLEGICKSWCPDHRWRTSRYALTEGNNHKLVAKFLRKRGLEALEQGMSLTDKARFRWSNKPSEINYKIFEEGRHVANHLSNSSLLTNKAKLFKALRLIDIQMKKKQIESTIFSSAKDFQLETYSLQKNRQLTEFLSRPNEGNWVSKNTSLVDGENCITLIGDVDQFKRSMLLKVRKGPREQL